MKIKNLKSFITAAAGLTLIVTAITTSAQKMKTDIPESITTPDTVETRLGTLKFHDGFPDDATVQKVYDNLDFQRGVQSFLAAIPGANLVAMRRSLRELGAVNGATIPIAETLLDSGLAPPLRQGMKRTGSRRFPAKDSTPCCASTDRSNRGSTGHGVRARSSWLNKSSIANFEKGDSRIKGVDTAAVIELDEGRKQAVLKTAVNRLEHSR